MSHRTRDAYHLEDIVTDHPLAPASFIAPTVVRLSDGDPAAAETVLTVELENVGGRNETRELGVSWNLTPLEAHAQTRGLPAKVVTEIAGYGVAAVLIARYTRFRLMVDETLYGDRFDFWVSDGHEWLGLEATGVVAGSAATLQRLKRQQLAENPYGVDGFVVVVVFRPGRALLSFHRHGEIKS
jgi:hypothetical protein